MAHDYRGDNSEIHYKYSITWDAFDFIKWYKYMYGMDREFFRILEKPYFYPEVFEEYENDEQWHNEGE
tara:strand:- start:294 stop:497 length:204 start_codon:yes stop_codon:yes gene_type:complete